MSFHDTRELAMVVIDIEISSGKLPVCYSRQYLMYYDNVDTRRLSMGSTQQRSSATATVAAVDIARTLTCATVDQVPAAELDAALRT